MMDLSKMNKPVIISPSQDFNVFGLRPGQAMLYKYLEKCAKGGVNIELKNVCEIYYCEVKKPNKLWLDDKSYYFRKHNDPDCPLNSLKNKDAYIFFSTDSKFSHYFNSWYVSPVKLWMKGVIGSLVMRGMLHIIPKIDTSLLETNT